MKYSFKLNDFWAWYVFIFSQFFLSFYLIQHSFFFFFFFLNAVQSTFRIEEMYHSISQQLDDERKRRIAAVQTLTIAALNDVEKQAESQRKLTNEAKEQLVASKEQVAALKQQLNEAKKLKDQVEKARM